MNTHHFNILVLKISYCWWPTMSTPMQLSSKFCCRSRCVFHSTRVNYWDINL